MYPTEMKTYVHTEICAQMKLKLRWGLEHSLLTEVTHTHLVSGLNEAQVPDVSSQKEFSGKQTDR